MKGILQGVALTGISTNDRMLRLRIIIETAFQLKPLVVRQTITVLVPADQHNAGFGTAILSTTGHIESIAKDLQVISVFVLHRMIETKRNISTPSS